MITAILDVLRIGQQLKNPDVWKHGQNLVSLLTTLFGSLVILLHSFGYNITISDADVSTLAGAVAIIVGIINGFITTASSDKIGIR